MNRKEAILRIKDHMEHHGIGKYPHLKLKEALDMAIAALDTPNKPLTCEQLREMDSIPIWVVDTTINRREWCYWKGGLAYSCEAHPEYYDPDEYGLWLAYRRPPEGEEDTQ